MRAQHVAFVLAKRLLDRYFRAADADGQPGAERPWLFPQLAEITKRWISDCVTLKDDAYIGLLAMAQLADEAVEKLYHSIVRQHSGERRLVPLLRPYGAVGSTLRQLRHHEGGPRHRPGTLPRQPRRVRQRLGRSPRRQARGPRRRTELREEPGPGLRHSIHHRRQATPTSRTSSLASTTTMATTTF